MIAPVIACAVSVLVGVVVGLPIASSYHSKVSSYSAAAPVAFQICSINRPIQIRHYEIKLTANSCIALSSSTKAVSSSSARTMKRCP
jgi:hypothetical protein